MNWTYALIVFGVGMLLPMQAGINAKLAQALQHPGRAALMQFTVGLIAILLALVAFRLLPFSPTLFNQTRWWHWLGGLCGAVLVLSSMILAPTLGATLFFALIIAGQLTASSIIDHFGWLGYAQHPMHWGRALGIFCLVLGVGLLQKF